MKPLSVIKKRSAFNINQSLSPGNRYRVLGKASLYHWDEVVNNGAKHQQGTTRCLHRGDIVIYNGTEDNKPTFKTEDDYLGIFRPLNCGMLPDGMLEPVENSNERPATLP